MASSSQALFFANMSIDVIDSSAAIEYKHRFDSRNNLCVQLDMCDRTSIESHENCIELGEQKIIPKCTIVVQLKGWTCKIHKRKKILSQIDGLRAFDTNRMISHWNLYFWICGDMWPKSVTNLLSAADELKSIKSLVIFYSIEFARLKIEINALLPQLLHHPINFMFVQNRWRFSHFPLLSQPLPNIPFHLQSIWINWKF